MLIRNVELECSGHRCDVRVLSGKIAAIGTLAPAAGEAVWEGQGHVLLPGLHDHHLHLQALAAARQSVFCGPPQVHTAEDLARQLQRAHRRAAPGAWLRGIGYHDSVAGALDRDALDRIVSDRPIRVQHRSGRLWILNSAALAALAPDDAELARFEQQDGRLTGRLFEADRWLRARLRGQRPDLADVSAWLAQHGVTGVTDASPDNGPDDYRHFSQLQHAGVLRQRVLMMGSMQLHGLAPETLIAVGPLKLHLHEAHLPDYEALVAQLRAAHAQGRAAAFHCVSRVELAFALGALADAGVRPGDRIEHAGVTPPELLEDIQAHKLTVVTQPNFIAERGDAYWREVEPEDRPWLYRLRAFVDAGVPLAGSTDAPFGHADPWRAMAAAVHRRSVQGRTLGPEEALSPEEALRLFLSPLQAPGQAPRRIQPGADADLCLLDRDWAQARSALDAVTVRATWRDGRCIYRAANETAASED